VYLIASEINFKRFKFYFNSADLFLFYCFSNLLKLVVIENVEAELQTMGEISLDVILYGKDFTNIIIKNHIESIVCSSDYMEVLSIFTLIYCREILYLCIISIYVHAIHFRKERSNFKTLQ